MTQVVTRTTTDYFLENFLFFLWPSALFNPRPMPGSCFNHVKCMQAGLSQRGETVEKIGRLLPTVHSLQIPNAAGCSTSSLSTLWPFFCFLSLRTFPLRRGDRSVKPGGAVGVYVCYSGIRLYFDLMGLSLIDW